MHFQSSVKHSYSLFFKLVTAAEMSFCDVCHPIRPLIWKYRTMIHEVLICHLSILFLLGAPKLSYSSVFQKTPHDPSFSPASPLGNNLHIYLNPCRSPSESNTSSVTYLCMASDEKPVICNRDFTYKKTTPCLIQMLS